MEQVVEVVACESPVEGFGGLVVAGFERGDPVGEFVEAGGVVGGEQFALDNGEVDLYLVQPRCVDRVWIMIAFGKASVRRAAAVQPRWEEPLSTIQNTRRALA